MSALAAGGGSSAVPMWIPAVVFVGLFGLVVMLMWRPPTKRTDNRLAQIEAYVRSAQPVAPAAGESEGRTAEVAVDIADRMLRSDKARQRFASRLERAGLRIKPAEWVLARLVGWLVGAVVAALLLPFYFVVNVPVGGGIGVALVEAYLSFRISRRAASFSAQLPDLLQLVASSLRSGFSLDQALDAVSREASEPAAAEFSRALAEVRLGSTLEDSLDAVAVRMSSADLAWVVMAVRISRSVGGNLAEVIATTVGTIRARVAVKGHVKALSAEGKLSGMVLVGMPIFIVLWFQISRPEYLRPLYTDPIGWAMSAVAVAGIGIGAFWMSRVVKVEV